MSEGLKVRVLGTIWSAYALAISVLSIASKDTDNVTGFGFVVSFIVLAIVTVKVVRA
ncbi:MAG: hypothetical protein HYT64_01720 [Candidatus Yanofskybacteria bacterium]|nr:hypothetical protein [Candidatus Yanofskybacteria bacterium]